jgi:nicotinamidase-related amidase
VNNCILKKTILGTLQPIFPFFVLQLPVLFPIAKSCNQLHRTLLFSGVSKTLPRRAVSGGSIFAPYLKSFIFTKRLPYAILSNYSEPHTKGSAVSTSSEKVTLNTSEVVMCLIDHQSGLFNLVKDMPVHQLRNNIVALAKVATMLRIPVITTASVPEGQNGPLIPEIKEFAPQARYIQRHGQINAWDVPEFVRAVEETGKKTILMTGTLTSVCLAFPALSAVAAGYTVYAIVDASGNHSSMATDLTIARLAQAGVIPVDTFAVIGELQQTWNRPDAMEYANLFGEYLLPEYQLLMESYKKSQEIARQK